ncbi:MAG: DUF1592 domain-containing protein, partial [Phycisphaerales bacterium]
MVAAWALAAAIAGVPGDVALPEGLGALLDAHCIDCHGGITTKGGLDLRLACSDGRASEDVLRAVRRRLARRDMPPEDEPERPSEEQYAAAVASIDRAVPPAWREVPLVRRLNRAQWLGAVRDVFGADALDGLSPDELLPADDVGEGFDTTAATLGLPALLVEKYMDAAERVAARIALPPSLERRRVVQAGSLMRAGGGGNSRGELAWLSSQGTLSARLDLPGAGRYRIEARVTAQQAGDAPARAALEVDGRRATAEDVTVSAPALATIAHELNLAAGEHAFSVRFLNDYWNPTADDPSQRDRNLAVAEITVTGPIGVVEDPAFERRATAIGGTGAAGVRLSRVAMEFGEDLFRRGVSKDEAMELVATATRAAGPNPTWDGLLRALATAMMVDPRFLLRIEPACAEGTCDLPPQALAERVAFFLWSSVPDAELRASVAAGQLDDEAGRRYHVARMLADPRAASLAERFAVQWLGIDRLESRSLDAQAYPGVDAALVADMRRETERLFDDVVRGRRPLRALLEARTTTLSPRLATHYGWAPADGTDAFECAIPDGRPGGILGHASILLATSNPTRTSPVKRGRWVLDALLDVPPAPPPPGVPQIPEDPLGRAGRSMRELMELHRSNPDCASCHVRMDAVGLAFERFDADGRVRSVVDGLPVDDVTELPDGRVLEGVSGVEQLVAEGDAFERALARHLLVYALGRGTADADDALLDALAARARVHGSFAELVGDILASDAFRRRR